MQRKIFIAGIVPSGIVAAFLLIGTAVMGKNEFFLLLNTDLGAGADFIFRYWTLLGDGIVWVPITLYFIICRRRYLPLIICAILISTLLTQGTKNFIFPGEPRPTYGLIDMAQIHVVDGVALNKVNSFPSGHTGTAFTIFLLACLLIRNKWVVPAGFFYACMVGYSRIYLAQHFPVDVGAGAITGIITALLSAFIQNRRHPATSLIFKLSCICSHY